MKRAILRTILFALTPVLNRTAAKYPAFQATLKKFDYTAQIRLKDGSVGRTFVIKNGRITSTSALNRPADVQMIFHDLHTAMAMSASPIGEVLLQNFTGDWHELVRSAQMSIVRSECRSLVR
jgi:hypothetical protein